MKGMPLTSLHHSNFLASPAPPESKLWSVSTMSMMAMRH